MIINSAIEINILVIKYLSKVILKAQIFNLKKLMSIINLRPEYPMHHEGEYF